MRLDEVMNKYPVTVHADTSIAEAAMLMVKHHAGALVVVGEDDRLAGVVTEGDLLYKKVRPHTPHYVNILGASIYYGGIGEYNASFKKLLATRVEELMTTKVITGKPETEVEDMVAVMVEQHLKTVPVVTPDNRLLGVFSRRDVMRLVAEEREEDAAEKK